MVSHLLSAMRELTEHYEDLVSQLEHVNNTHQAILSFQANLSDELRVREKRYLSDTDDYFKNERWWEQFTRVSSKVEWVKTSIWVKFYVFAETSWGHGGGQRVAMFNYYWVEIKVVMLPA